MSLFINMIIVAEKDECASNPCQFDGTCADDVNKYTCTCNDGYMGIECEIGGCKKILSIPICTLQVDIYIICWATFLTYKKEIYLRS